jgi:hypothetical protein
MLQFVKRLKSWSRSVLMMLAFSIIAVIGLVDYLTGHEISFSVFYLLGVVLAVWFVGNGFGILVSVLSVAVWVAGDVHRRRCGNVAAVRGGHHRRAGYGNPGHTVHFAIALSGFEPKQQVSS